MAKQTWINVDGTWKKVKNVWINAGGIWKSNVIPKGNINGVWKEFMSYGPSFPILYEQGFEVIPWVQGYTSNGTFTKNSDNMYLYAEAVEGSEVTAVSNIRLNLSNYNTLNADVICPHNVFIRKIYLVVSDNKMGNRNDYIEMYMISNRTDELQTLSLDISQLTGDYYIRIHIINGEGPMWSILENSLYIYKIWLE